jgi:hypothetical protein
MDKILLPELKSTTAKIHKHERIIATIRSIVIIRGIPNLSINFTIGYITNASKKAIVKGKKTAAAIFKTAVIIITQIKTIKKNTARPE